MAQLWRFFGSCCWLKPARLKPAKGSQQLPPLPIQQLAPSTAALPCRLLPCPRWACQGTAAAQFSWFQQQQQQQHLSTRRL